MSSGISKRYTSTPALGQAWQLDDDVVIPLQLLADQVGHGNRFLAVINQLAKTRSASLET